ncbi:forkhead-associated domain-containing protein / FHA domain-containing protein [Perilla frutescens var. hirtella]|uniref:Forkhead-associated domain-containing protein / FHA domain-containing protein n=1 Tax=Perilla frutescens var. hirtella TaxID=608512 RepID=A0AAD4IR11_PERFH|nr:forkhead-associated domain-containing protein / FHA domain-containing protein [Perilla frutescens var. hirtella]
MNPLRLSLNLLARDRVTGPSGTLIGSDISLAWSVSIMFSICLGALEDFISRGATFVQLDDTLPATKTWQRLENVGLLHDAIPHPSDRVQFPMHVKVGRRRFLSKKDGSSFGWVYCGSHNLSAAAWGRPMSHTSSSGNMRNNSVLGSRLHISNYELGIVFIVPPPDAVDSAKENIENLDDIVMPFVVPPPKYRPTDKPASAQAIREALAEVSEQEKEISEAAAALPIDGDWMEDGVTEQEEEEVLETTPQYVTQEKEDEKAYADKLWSQVDSSESC